MESSKILIKIKCNNLSSSNNNKVPKINHKIKHWLIPDKNLLSKFLPLMQTTIKINNNSNNSL